MSGEWIGVVLITALLVIMMGYSVFLAFRGGGSRKKANPREDSPSRAQPGQRTDRKAA
jgi:hypothetical protein